jgi:cytochrome c-type biogenesis protein CcmH/NrfG
VLQSPDLFEAHLALGELLAEGGQLREALDSFENAGRVAPPGNKQAQEAIEKWRAKAKPVKP